MKRIIYIVFAAFVLTMVPATYACAQNDRTGSAGHIETPRERKAREAREAEARKRKQQQEAAARRQREEEARKKREAEAAAQRQREEEARKQREAEEAARRQREAEERERQRVFRELEANMVYVEGGTFTMGPTSEQGSDANDWEKPAHQVTLSSFHLCKYEVTQELWQAVMGSNPSKYKGGKRPVEQVSWEQCQRFITRLNQLTSKNYRLPTEAEWEYAARGGNRSQRYKYAGGNSIGDVAWHKSNSSDQTHDVGTKRANELGLYDMSGNVYEWCNDRYDNYSSISQTNPRGAYSGSLRVARGGCWYYDANGCRVSYRDSRAPTYTDPCLGLRLAY